MGLGRVANAVIICLRVAEKYCPVNATFNKDTAHDDGLAMKTQTSLDMT
jgi:hypothetical protein